MSKNNFMTVGDLFNLLQSELEDGTIKKEDAIFVSSDAEGNCIKPLWGYSDGRIDSEDWEWTSKKECQLEEAEKEEYVEDHIDCIIIWPH